MIPWQRLPRSAVRATALGNDYYFTGRACPRGHVAVRKIGVGCLECEGAARARKYVEHELKLARRQAGYEPPPVDLHPANWGRLKRALRLVERGRDGAKPWCASPRAKRSLRLDEAFATRLTLRPDEATTWIRRLRDHGYIETYEAVLDAKPVLSWRLTPKGVSNLPPRGRAR